MTSSFSLAQPFAERFALRLFTKEDGDVSCSDAARSIGTSDFATLNQVHGNRTIRVTRPFDRSEDADGMITNIPNLVLIVRAADCQMFAVYDPKHNVIGALHAGWRGLVSGAIPRLIREMQSAWNTMPSSLYVFAGPSLCTNCAEFSHPGEELPSIDPKFMQGNCVNLRAIADEQFIRGGILRDHLQRHPDCTRCHPEKYWTWRGGDRDAVKAGHTNLLACVLKPVLG